jgi:hypothetical protein
MMFRVFGPPIGRWTIQKGRRYGLGSVPATVNVVKRFRAGSV